MRTRLMTLGMFLLLTATVLTGCDRTPQKRQNANDAPPTTADPIVHDDIERLLDDVEGKSPRHPSGSQVVKNGENTIPVTVAKNVKCEECKGTGWMHGEKKECECRSFSSAPPSPNCVFCKGTGFNPCIFCKGTGSRTLVQKTGNGTSPAGLTCRTCDGSGRVPCDTCGGRGRIKKSVTLGNSSDDYECAVCSGSGKTRCLSCGGASIP